MSVENPEWTYHQLHDQNKPNPKCEYCAESGLQKTLREMAGTKLPDKTLFGDLNGLVPQPYSKFVNMDNPPLQ